MRLLLWALDECPGLHPFLKAVLSFAWCLSFALLLRHGEVCPRAGASRSCFPRNSWFRTKSPTLMEFHLPASKTDVFREGVTLVCAKVGGPLCPVTRFSTMVRECTFIRRPDSILLTADGVRPLTRDVSISALKQCAQLLNDRFGIGLDPDAIGNGSFRRGGASWLHELGVSDALIKVLGRWRSNTYQIYIERPLSATVSAQRLLSVSAGDALGSARRWLGGTRAFAGF